MKIKVSIMTNKTYPKYKVKDFIIDVNEKEESYYWEYKELENKFKTSIDEYPVEMDIDILEVSA